jgi:hypothetical protein
MRKNLTDILSNNGEPIDEGKLMDYLSGKLTDEERNALEKKMASSDIDDDALDGLLMIEDSRKVLQHQSDINKWLKEKLKQKKPVVKRKKLQTVNASIVITVVVLLAALFVWFLVHYLQNR